MNNSLRQDIFQWDVQNWSQALRLWQEHLPANKGKKALAVGERDGGLALWLALNGFEVTATDLNGISEKGKQLHQKYGVQEAMHYQQADATALPFDEGTFDVVIFKSMLGALAEKDKQAKAVQEMHRVLQPGGVLLFAENLQGSRWHRSLRKRFTNWQSYWRYLNFKKDMDLFAPFTETTFATYGYLGLLGRTEGQRNSLGKIDSLILPLVGKKCRYILVGAAKK